MRYWLLPRQKEICVQLTCCSCIFSRREYPIIPRNTSSGLFPLLRSRRSSFPQIGISPTQHTGNFSKRPSRGLFPIFLNTAPILLDREARLLRPILVLKKGFSHVMEGGKRRRLSICTLRIRCLQDSMFLRA